MARLLFASLALALGLASPVHLSAQDRPSPLRVAEIWEIPTLDPTQDGTLMKEKAMVTETLVTGKPDFTLAPGLAISWKRDSDTVWTFALRPGVKFHDGSPLTAQAAAASLTNALQRSGTARSYTKIAGITARDDQTLEITTSEPFPALPAALVYASSAIVSPASPKMADGTIERPIGTGPFKVTAWQPAAQSFTVERFNGYWGEKPSIPAITFRGIPDPTTRSLELQKGSVDFTSEVPYGDLDTLAGKGFTVSRNVTARNYVLNFGSLKDTPFADIRVRKALSLAIDRDEIAQYVLFGMGRAGIGAFPGTMAFADTSIAAPKTDLAAARKLLTEAGYAPGSGGVMAKDGKPLGFTLYTYAQRPGLVPIAGALQAQLRKLGVPVEIKVTTFSAIAKEMKPGDARLAALASAMYPHPDFYLRQTYHSAGATNTWGYANPKIDAALAVAITTRDEAERKAAYDLVQRIAAEEEPCLTIAHYGVNVAMRPGIANYTFNPIAHDYMLDPQMTLAR
ncbi:peptide/nickel transport system substrate-binding protein [Bosea sp. BE271]|uniref:ABC transporter substrate-binding protein n=1 Tax=Bosea TaxID=85413 RepID=UPI0028544C3C|nr:MULTISPECIES: ABC transporter substrate-binding protein [Bosea]MDR6831031.1 peptide/nickel transport system substrate-binding protein [Bosea robiniae]MDR6897777.1 peptide/nickel transport system substrate-binding protein [Bosea sp. BE109]MDR7141174.1 peptide/nickel transport system substrate-binding protein [Bosea sp. BE168]MDR7177688.1 peptide/nickel transport system substrate-binding protein [Bosea sp. BE271]